MNVCLHELDFPVLNLSQMFNRIVSLGAEWELSAWFNHYAGVSPPYFQDWCWRREADDFGETLKAQSITSGNFRVPLMSADIASRLGNWERFFSPSQFHRTTPDIDLRTDDGVRLSLFARDGAVGCIYGAYAKLEPGHYTARILVHPVSDLTDSSEAPGPTCCYSDVYIHGFGMLSPKSSEAPKNGEIVHQFCVTEPVVDVQFRVHAIGYSFKFFGVKLTKAVSSSSD